MNERIETNERITEPTNQPTNELRKNELVDFGARLLKLLRASKNR